MRRTFLRASLVTLAVAVTWYIRLDTYISVAVDVGLWEAMVAFAFDSPRIIDRNLFWDAFEEGMVDMHRAILEKQNSGIYLQRESVGFLSATFLPVPSTNEFQGEGQDGRIKVTFYASEETLRSYPHLFSGIAFGVIDGSSVTKHHNLNHEGYHAEFDIPLPHGFVLSAMNASGVKTPNGTPIEPAPVVLFVHGGGFVYLNTSAYDKLLRQVANHSGAVVISIDYRQPPESPFPTPLDDCMTAIRWLVNESQKLGVDMSRFAILADSAGGNLAISAVASALHDPSTYTWGQSVAALGLVYPMICQKSCDSGSRKEYSDFFFSRVPALDYFSLQYLGDYVNDTDWRVHVGLIPEWLMSQFPPTFISAVTRDTLRDEALEFHQQLKAVGAPTEFLLAKGIHGLFGSPFKGGRSEAFGWMISRLRRSVRNHKIQNAFRREM